MYLRAKDPKTVLKLAETAVRDLLLPGQFLKVGYDIKENIKSWWVFVPDFVSDMMGEVKVD